MITAAQVLMSSEKPKLFENLKGLLSTQEVSILLGISPKTIYDWKYRPVVRRVPEGLFVKFNRKLFVRTDILRSWIVSQNTSNP